MHWWVAGLSGKGSDKCDIKGVSIISKRRIAHGNKITFPCGKKVNAEMGVIVTGGVQFASE